MIATSVEVGAPEEQLYRPLQLQPLSAKLRIFVSMLISFSVSKRYALFLEKHSVLLSNFLMLHVSLRAFRRTAKRFRLSVDFWLSYNMAQSGRDNLRHIFRLFVNIFVMFSEFANNRFSGPRMIDQPTFPSKHK